MLSAKKREAIVLLLKNYTDVEIANRLNIAVMTLWRWGQQPEFQREFKKAYDKMCEYSEKEIQEFISMSIKRIIEDVRDNNSVETALEGLKAFKNFIGKSQSTNDTAQEDNRERTIEKKFFRAVRNDRGNVYGSRIGGVSGVDN